MKRIKIREPRASNRHHRDSAPSVLVRNQPRDQIVVWIYDGSGNATPMEAGRTYQIQYSHHHGPPNPSWGITDGYLVEPGTAVTQSYVGLNKYPGGPATIEQADDGTRYLVVEDDEG